MPKSRKKRKVQQRIDNAKWQHKMAINRKRKEMIKEEISSLKSKRDEAIAAVKEKKTEDNTETVEQTEKDIALMYDSRIEEMENLLKQ